jgi:uncharacterized protein YodC (DUF2158 family)
MNCPKCKGDGRMIGGLVDAPGPNRTTIKVAAQGWGQCDACQGTGRRSVTVYEPPTIAEVMAKGFSKAAAAVIVQQEQDKAGRGERPYGPNEPTSPWGTQSREIIPEPPDPEPTGDLAAALQQFTIGQHVALISGGPVMTITADLGDEYACEWPIFGDDGKPNGGRDSRVFAAAVLKPIVE